MKEQQTYKNACRTIENTRHNYIDLPIHMANHLNNLFATTADRHFVPRQVWKTSHPK